jgi:hypothetical protein
LNIYRKYYGGRMALLIGAIFYLVMVAAAWIVEALFQVLHLVPAERNAQVVEAAVQLNYTTVLDLLFLVLPRGTGLAVHAYGWPGDASDDGHASRAARTHGGIARARFDRLFVISITELERGHL